MFKKSSGSLNSTVNFILVFKNKLLLIMLKNLFITNFNIK